jgi:hypothetical protein
MSEYFITQEENYKAYRRNEKLNSLGLKEDLSKSLDIN